MKKESNSGISFFQRYLTVWVIVCMLIGIMLGHFLPGMKEALNHLEYAGISIPMAVLIWIMIYPMMMKVDFKSIKNIGKNPKGLFVTWIVNWLIKPFTMYGIASFFFFVVFKTWITPDLATEYLAGAVLLGAAPCTAMVFVWSTLTKGNPAYTVVQVASNDIIILFAFVPIVKFLLGVSNVSVPFQTLFMSVVLFVVIPLAAGIITRLLVVRKKGTEYFEQTLGISRYRLCREFSATFHTSPLQYLQGKKIEAAKSLLLSTDNPIHEVGAMVGIDNTNHFIHLFKKHTGVTPFVYRQNAPQSIRETHCPSVPVGLPPR